MSGGGVEIFFELSGEGGDLISQVVWGGVEPPYPHIDYTVGWAIVLLSPFFPQISIIIPKTFITFCLLGGE